MSETTPQHPAAPETETDANGKVELTYDERTTLAVAIHDLPANPCQCTHVYAAVERIVAERVRVVEGEREHWKRVAGSVREQAEGQQARAESAEDERDAAREKAEWWERTCTYWNEQATEAQRFRDMNAARAESAEAAHEAEKAAHERLRAGVEALANEWEQAQGRSEVQGERWVSPHVKALRSLLGGGGAR